MDAEILIRMPLHGKITVTATGKGKSKIKIVEMFEEIRPRFPKVFERWYQMQFGTDELKKQLEIAAQTGKECLNLQ